MTILADLARLAVILLPGTLALGGFVCLCAWLSIRADDRREQAAADAAWETMPRIPEQRTRRLTGAELAVAAGVLRARDEENARTLEWIAAVEAARDLNDERILAVTREWSA